MSIPYIRIDVDLVIKVFIQKVRKVLVMPWHAESGLEGSGSRECYLWRVLITNLNVEVPFCGFKLETKSVHGRINAMAKPGKKKKVLFSLLLFAMYFWLQLL